MGAYLIFSVSRGRGVERHRLNCGGRDKSGCLIHEFTPGQGWAVRRWRRLREWGGERGFLETGSGVEKRGDSLAADMAGRSPEVGSRSRFRHVVCCSSGGVRMGWGNSELAMCLAS